MRGDSMKWTQLFERWINNNGYITCHILFIQCDTTSKMSTKYEFVDRCNCCRSPLLKINQRKNKNAASASASGSRHENLRAMKKHWKYAVFLLPPLCILGTTHTENTHIHTHTPLSQTHHSLTHSQAHKNTPTCSSSARVWNPDIERERHDCNRS
jgi:hypothetical protein